VISKLESYMRMNPKIDTTRSGSVEEKDGGTGKKKLNGHQTSDVSAADATMWLILIFIICCLPLIK